MELNSLPNDCLLLLLELFPVNVQAQLRAVCTRWKWLIERVWLKVNKIDIKYAYHGFGYYIVIDNHKVAFKVDSKRLKRFVTRGHFPGVTFLRFGYLRNNTGLLRDQQALLSHCLAQWTVTLTDLTLNLAWAASDRYQSSVWTQIDSMKSLKSLELHFTRFGYQREEAWKLPDNLSILANLEKFVLDDYMNGGGDALTQLGPNLRHLNLHMYNSSNIFELIIPKLISLTELSIEIEKFPKPLYLLPSLAQLTQLSKLNLVIANWNEFVCLYAHNLEYPKLTSIKHLCMKISFPIKFMLWRQRSERTREDSFQLLNDFDRHFFATIPIMFHALETIEVKFDFRESYDQEFVDMFQDKLKLKFVNLREGKFTLGLGLELLGH